MVDEYPENYKDFDYGVSAIGLHDYSVGSSRTPLLLLLGAVTFVLLIAVANVSNLMLVRAETRNHEISLRSALGASRPRIARQLLAECLVLSLGGGIAGLLLAVTGLRALLTLAGSTVPRVEYVSVDIRVLAFAAAISMAAGLLAGVVPAIRISERRPGHALQLGSRSVAAGGRSLLRSALVIVEVALAVMLVIGAGLMIRTLSELEGIDVGFRTENILTAEISLPRSAYPEGPRISEYFRTLEDRVGALPGVVSAGIVWQLPLASGFGAFSIQVEDREVETIGETPHTLLQITSPGYFSSLGISPLQGRLHDQHDIPGRPFAAVVNEAFATQILDGEDVLRRRVRQWGDGPPWFQIVGVVPNVLQEGLERDPRPTLYLNHAQIGIEGLPPDFFLLDAARNMALVVHAERDPAALADPVREVVRRIDPSVPISDLSTMTEVRASAAADREFPTVLLVIFGCIALTLAILGVYGVVAYGASRRTREIGIRMALGGDATGIRRMVVRNGLTPVVAGLLIGVAGAVITSRTMTSLLYGVVPTDPATLVTVPLIIIAAALAAIYIPAFRASRVDPAQVLRSE
jgi:predicted permease